MAVLAQIVLEDGGGGISVAVAQHTQPILDISHAYLIFDDV